MNKITSRTIFIATGIICILLAASLIGVIANYTSTINSKDAVLASRDSTINELNAQLAVQEAQIAEDNNTIASQDSQMANLTSQVSSLASQVATLESQASADKSTITNLQTQVADANAQINALNSNVASLQDQVNSLTEIIDMNKSQLSTLVFHVCEKGEGYSWGHLPNASDTYNQILALNNNTYSVLLLPEYKGHGNWTEELVWLTNNFGGPQGIPIMLDVFGGGENTMPIPMLSTSDILVAMGTCNVQYLRIAEVVSWHMEHQQVLPTAYITDLLAFARVHNLKVFWTEWKAETFAQIQNFIKGYEDIVTVSFSTNSQDLQPTDGFRYLNGMFNHWGASVQAWYWTSYYNASLMDMPASLLSEHALAAKRIGAEVIQFEPYWYFFDNGQATQNLILLETTLA
jgi:uncharacterized coiled-coil protein SlyX